MRAAMEVSVSDVPVLNGSVAVCPDASGSMSPPAKGYRQGATSVVCCIDVAALVAAAVLRENSGVHILPFKVAVREVPPEARDTIVADAGKPPAPGGGGTNCPAPLSMLNAARIAPDLVTLVSDNRSWMDANRGGQATTMVAEWTKLKTRNRAAKLVCTDIRPHGTTHAAERRTC